jgi:hypothetical protein
MKKLLWLIAVLWLLGPVPIAAQTTGYLTRSNCATITTPIDMSVACLQTTTVGGRTAGHIYIYRGGAWVDVDSGGGGGGTVTSVAVTVPPFLSIAGSPITTSGTLAFSLSGTALPITSGGTGATTAAGARTSLGLAIGTDVQAFDAELTAFAALSGTGLIAHTGAGTLAERTIQGVTNETLVTNGGGVAGNPLIGLATTIDLGAKVAVTPWRIGPTAPATCTIGQAFYDTDAPPGQNLMACTAANTWTLQSGGGGGGGHIIQEEGASLTQRANLNFIGAALTASDGGVDVTNITLSQSPASASVVGTGRAVNTTAPLTGTGTLAADLTIACPTCATTATTATGQVAVMTSATGIRSYSTLGYDGTDLSVGSTAGNYVHLVTAALTGVRTLTVPDAATVTIIPTTATAGQFLTHVTSGGVQTKAQPAFSNLSGAATDAQIPDLNTLSTGLTASRCVETTAAGLLTVAAAVCGSGGGLANAYASTAGNSGSASAAGATQLSILGTNGLSTVAAGGTPNTVTISGAGIASATQTFTNKTLDCEATGNACTNVYEHYIPAAGGTVAAPGSVWSLPATNPAVAFVGAGTYVIQPVLNFADGANALTAQTDWWLPQDWVGTVNAIIMWYGNASGNVVWQLGVSCAGVGETTDIAFATTVFAANAASVGNISNTASTTLTMGTGSPGTCAAGELMNIKITRDPTHGSDTMAGTASFMGIKFIYRRTT